MKIKSIVLAGLLVFVSVYLCAARVKSNKPVGALSAKEFFINPSPLDPRGPDLIILSTTADDLDSGRVSVKMKNQGQRLAGRAELELSLSYGSQSPVSISKPAAPLKPGATEIVMFEIGKSIVQAKFCATVDTLNQVAESNESNNKRCGQFGGKP